MQHDSDLTEQILKSDRNMKKIFELFFLHVVTRYAVAHLFEALLYLLEGREFNSRWSNWDFPLPFSLRPAVPLGSTQSVTEMSTGDIFWRVKAAGA